jgi:hypothetical protein
MLLVTCSNKKRFLHDQKTCVDGLIRFRRDIDAGRF